MPLCFNFTQHSSQLFFPLSIQEGLVAIFEGVCERVVGSTFALQSYPEYLDFFRRCAVPDFSMPPLTRGPVLAHLLKLALPPFYLGQCPLCPLLIPWGRALGVHTCYGRLSNAPRQWAATSGPPRPCAPVVERPADGLHLWRLLALHFRRRSHATPGRRESALAEH